LKQQKTQNIKMPEHIAFIMDGNGRWAKRRLMPRTYGHKIGVDALERTLKHCSKLGLKAVSVFAFSTENWKRPKSEVDEIFRLTKEFLQKIEKENSPENIKNCTALFFGENIKINHMGVLDGFDDDMIKVINRAVEITKNNDGLVFNIGFNYGGQLDILQAVNKSIEEKLKSQTEINKSTILSKLKITENDIEKNLLSKGFSKPDIVVRTSGEMRVSNFMLWQMAYAEFIFVPYHWPDMNAKKIDDIILEYSSRDRRFGNINEDA
jgi:undecaprenyl diphosphate synthase